MVSALGGVRRSEVEAWGYCRHRRTEDRQHLSKVSALGWVLRGERGWLPEKKLFIWPITGTPRTGGIFEGERARLGTAH